MKRGKRCNYIFISKIRIFYMLGTVLPHTEQHKRTLVPFVFFSYCWVTHVEVRGQAMRVGSLPAPCGAQGSNSAHYLCSK